MLLRNLHVIGQEDSDLRIEGRQIAHMYRPGRIASGIDLEGFIAFPGLINAHDHLEFNLFPQLGAKYNDYTEWGPHIHERYKDEIDKIIKVPKLIRVKWGLLKNILNGVSTVVEHGPLQRHIESEHIDIVKFSYLHSVALEKWWRIKLNNPFNWLPVMIHIGEGASQKAQNEIDVLVRNNLLKKKLIGIHGIAMTKDQAEHFDALVWCPDSNLFLYDKTASIDRLKKHTKILFGTDSTLSASANLWEQLRLARKLKMLSDQELFNAVGSSAATVFNKQDLGSIAAGKQVDLCIARRKHADKWESFYALDPVDIMAVIKGGKVIYYDEEMQDRLHLSAIGFSPVQVGASRKYLLKELASVVNALEKFDITLPLAVKSLEI